jgi:hypothetical protein
LQLLRRAAQDAQAVQAQESPQAVRGDFDLPRHTVSQAFVPQDTTASAHEFSKSSQRTEQGPVPQTICADLHASSLAHVTAQAPPPLHAMVALSQLAFSRQRTSQSIPSGHLTMLSLHWSLTSHAMMQTPASQRVHSGGQVGTMASVATPQPSPVPASLPAEELPPSVFPCVPELLPPGPVIGWPAPLAPALDDPCVPEPAPAAATKVNSSPSSAGQPAAQSPQARASTASARDVTRLPPGWRRPTRA